MADDYGTCPNDLFEDERLADAPLQVISGHALIMVLADDYGLFDGNPKTMARRIGSTVDEVEQLFALLEARRIVGFYEAPGRGGVGRRVGRILDFHSYRGHPDRVSQPSQRGASLHPTEDGSYIPSRRERGLGRPAKSNPEPTRAAAKSPRASTTPKVGMTAPQADKRARATSVQPSCNDRAGDVQAACNDRAAFVQVSTAQHSTADPPASRSDHAARQAACEPSPSGSTDARVTEAPSPAEPPPALEGREAQAPEDGWEDRPPSRPTATPPPRRLTRDEEAARVAALRAQFATLEPT